MCCRWSACHWRMNAPWHFTISIEFCLVLFSSEFDQSSKKHLHEILTPCSRVGWLSFHFTRRPEHACEKFISGVLRVRSCLFLALPVGVGRSQLISYPRVQFSQCLMVIHAPLCRVQWLMGHRGIDRANEADRLFPQLLVGLLHYEIIVWVWLHCLDGEHSHGDVCACLWMTALHVCLCLKQEGGKSVSFVILHSFRTWL